MSTCTFLELQTASVAQLVLASQTGDRAAFGQLFERYERHVFAIALRRLGNYSEAQELCQDVFIQALQKIAQLREVECFGGWLRSITHRMAINRLTRSAVDRPMEAESLEASCVENDTPLSAMLAGERVTQVQAGLQRLRELDRATLVAFYVKGQSLLEMSDEFDAPLGTIKRRLHVARQRLAKEVEPLAAV
ncbi:MAG: sigma-70 family RNA polymerase sigma factor [Planctomycetota bacterium]|nr:sigma-70 family RNA polymerase sigma factor [Planctomycetota bacterium]